MCCTTSFKKNESNSKRNIRRPSPDGTRGGTGDGGGQLAPEQPNKA